MLSINSSSIQRFIHDPANYHLVNERGTIKAIEGRLPANERIHQAALASLDALEPNVAEAEPHHCCPRFMARMYPSNFAMATQCKKTEFIYKIKEWASKAESGENRIKAAQRIIEAYTSNASILNLAVSNLKSLPPEIGNLTQLRTLYLSDNQLTHLPPEIGNLTQLIELELNYNQLTDLPPEIGNLTQLTKLYLFNNQLTHLPPEIGNLSKLTTLNIDHNPITNGRTAIEVVAAYPFLLKIPAYKSYLEAYYLQNICEINGLALEFIPEELKTIELISAALYQEPASIAFIPARFNAYINQTKFFYKIKEWARGGQPTEYTDRAEAAKRIIKAYVSNQQTLDLHNLNLKSLPPEIGNLTHLIGLFLRGNQLREVPLEIGNLTQLRVLYLFNNQLTHLPPEIDNLTQLTDLSLADNQLTHLPPKIGNLTQLKVLHLFNNPITTGRTRIEVIAAYPFLLKIPAYETLLYTQALQAICGRNGLALEFIPQEHLTDELVSIAINQNPASIAFAPQELITYDLAKFAVSLNPIVTLNFIPQEHLTDELVSIAINQNLASIAFIPARFNHLINFDIAKRAVAIDPSLAKFVPDEVIDVHSLLSQLEDNPDLLKDEPYLLSLLIKVGPLDKISDTMYEDAIACDYRLLGCMPLDIQNSELGYKLILEVLTQNPKAYYMIEPAFFNEKMLTTMIHHHKNTPDLKPILKDIISKMDTQDEALVSRMSDLAYPLSQYFHDDKEVLLMLISKYGISLKDISDDLKADYDIVKAAIHNQPDEIRFSLVSPGNGQKDLIAYAQERKRQLRR